MSVCIEDDVLNDFLEKHRKDNMEIIDLKYDSKIKTYVYGGTIYPYSKIVRELKLEYIDICEGKSDTMDEHSVMNYVFRSCEDEMKDKLIVYQVRKSYKNKFIEALVENGFGTIYTIDCIFTFRHLFSIGNMVVDIYVERLDTTIHQQIERIIKFRKEY